jgi:hypothetical protein
MYQETKRLAASLAVVLLAVTVTGCNKGQGPEDGTYDAAATAQLVDCLSSKGAVLYGASWCPYTVAQLEAFGASSSQLNYVECTQDPATCTGAGVTAYPTWVVNGRMIEGYCDLATIASAAGCN